MSRVKSLKSIAVACPGQGIITRGCLYNVRQHVPIFQNTLECLDSVFGEKVSDFLLERPPKTPDPWSMSTANAQPAIVASTYALVQILKSDFGVDLTSDKKVSFFLGHSLGEYTALLLSGVITLPQVLSTVRKRGLLMEQLVKDKEYEMRVLVFRPAAYKFIYETAKSRKVLACANNSSQISISGEPAILDAVIDELNSPKKTVLKQVQLPVKIPFHNHILSQIEPELASLVPSSSQPSKPVISNYTGEISSGNLFENTVKCNSTPVQWKQSMELLEDAKVDAVINLGPGSALDAINSKFSMENMALKSAEDMQHLAERLKR
ncbi:hypothetical protein OXX79_010891 [Metschnikowia pulcherrima]